MRLALILLQSKDDNLAEEIRNQFLAIGKRNLPLAGGLLKIAVMFNMAVPADLSSE